MVAVLCLAAFGPALSHPLVPSWDDGRFLVEFEPVRSVSVDHFITIVSEVHFEAFHPLHLLSYWLDVPWAGTAGPAIHATSLLLWIVALFLLLEVYIGLGLPLFAAFVGTMVVGLHPIQVEAVTWATGRKEILALGFSCAVILAHLASVKWNDRAAWGARVFYLLAAMSKTTVLPLPGVLFLIDVLLREKPWRAALSRQVPLLLVGLSVGGVVVAIWDDSDMIRDHGAPFSASLWAATYTHHLATAFFPASLSPVYPIHRHGDLPLTAWLGPLSLALVLALAYRYRLRGLAFAVLTFALLLLPASNILPVYFQFQDRYISLPLIGLGFGFATLVARLDALRGPTRSALLAVALGLVVVLGGRTAQYGRAWSSDLHLWGHAASTQPASFYAWLNLGHTRRDAGELSAAIVAYDRTIAIAPDLALGYGGRFSAVAMKDVRDYGATGPDAKVLAARFMRDVDDAERLRLFAGQLAERGYRNAVLMALGRSLDIDPIDDERLLHAERVQRERGHTWLSEFYISRLTGSHAAVPGPPGPTQDPDAPQGEEVADEARDDPEDD
jgi:hypothetical protein